jgi:hypothetical protein
VTSAGAAMRGGAEPAVEPFSWTEAGGAELVLLGVAVLLTVVVAGVFATVLLRRDVRDRGGAGQAGDERGGDAPS